MRDVSLRDSLAPRPGGGNKHRLSLECRAPRVSNLQRVIGVRVLSDVPTAQELADDVLPLFRRTVLPDPVGRELVVTEPQYTLTLGSAQDVDDVAGPEALPG